MWKSIITGASGILGSIIQGVYNTKQIKATNEANRELVRMQNEAAAAESEKAYQRSRPEIQVANMMNAGMSRAGAINALNGGGSYQPAPVATSQDQAPQIDTSSAINAIQAAADIAEKRDLRKLQEKQLQVQIEDREKQLQEQKRQFDEQLNFEKQKWSDEAAKRGQELDNLVKQGAVLDNTAKKLGFESNIAETNAEVLDLLKDREVDTQKVELLARKLRAQNEQYIEQVRSKGIKNLSPEAFQQLINNITEREAVATTVEMFQTYAKDKGHKVAKKLLKEFIEQSIKKGAPLTNAVL